MRLLIIGGSDAGISAALRARELDDSAQITVMLADSYPNFSICGLPFYLSGETPDWKQLAHRTEFDGIELLKNTRATYIDVANAIVLAKDEGRSQAFPYDRLVIATGAVPTRPQIEGLDEPGVFPLHTMEDSFRVHEYLSREKRRSALIIGAGYIGMEMADALTHSGIEVSVASRPRTVLPTVDWQFGELVAQELQRHRVHVWCGVEVAQIRRSNGRLIVTSSSGQERTADVIIVGTGVKPDTDLARDAGIKIGQHEAIMVSRNMQTNIPGIYAAGDCVETWHRLRQAYAYLPLGTTSHKQGRIAGENAVGGNAEFAGVVGTQVVKVFDLAVARAGLLDPEASGAGFNPVTIESEFWDHKVYYPGATRLHFRVTGDRSTGKLLGAQIVGSWKAEISKRIDIFATALFHGMRVDELNDLDLSYTPPLGSPWDAVQMSAQAWSHAIRTQHFAREVMNA
jgi:NADPH-dependent 2,4-dienoyl-CoA reductase/sulfur reductase-like enzyme